MIPDITSLLLKVSVVGIILTIVALAILYKKIIAPQRKNQREKIIIREKALIVLTHIEIMNDSQIRDISICFRNTSTSVFIAAVADWDDLDFHFRSKFAQALIILGTTDNVSDALKREDLEPQRRKNLEYLQRKIENILKKQEAVEV